MTERIQETVASMTTEEKMRMLTGIDNWRSAAVERLGIPSVRMSDGPHGLRKVSSGASSATALTEPSLCFPTSAAMAATWNRELVEASARALGEIAGAAEVDLLLGPGVNMKRTPLCGRNFEYYSEDPYLSGELASRYIRGLQSSHVGACLKHFAANNQEFDRFQISSEIDERTLREIYLKAFEAAVVQAAPWTVMCAYNRLNGVYCSENPYTLRTILREEWLFDGVVISDWWAVHDRSRSLKASLELEMPYSEKALPNLQSAYEVGYIDDHDLDEAVGRLLSLVFKVVESRKARKMAVDLSAHRHLLTDAAREAMTLLKNEGGLLPLDLKAGQRILVLGGSAETPLIQGGGSSEVRYEGADSPLGVLRKLAREGATIEYQPLYRHSRGMLVVDGLNEALAAARRADLVLFFTADHSYAETEDRDRERIALPPTMERLLCSVAAVNENMVVVLQAGSAVDMGAWIGSVKAVLFTWFAGQGAGTAIAEVLAGLVNPSGKTAETFPLRLEDTPAYRDYPGNGSVARYGEGPFVGYRHYDSSGMEVLFPFGHGLSYTSYEYSALSVSPNEGDSPFPIRVSCRVKNCGDRRGKETVQLYLRDLDAKVARPFQELAGFEKVDLAPGEERQVSFSLSERAFSYYSVVFHSWHWESGEFEIRVGASSRDIRLSGVINLVNARDLS